MGINKSVLKFRTINDISALEGFECGVNLMDSFIKNGLLDCIVSHYCVLYGCYNSDDILVGFVALSADSVTLDADDKDDLQKGYSDTPAPNLPNTYDVFWQKIKYPAIEIAYLAVAKQFRGKGIGSFIVESVCEKARSQSFVGCQFITVNALYTSEYNAVGFYSRLHFARYGNIVVSSDIVPMYRTLYP